MVLADTTLEIGNTDVITYNGVTYSKNSEGLQYNQTEWKWLTGGTIKGGANYNINEFHNAFFNAGYLSRTPRFANVIDTKNEFFRNIENEKIIAFELGHSSRYKKIATNINVYYTRWKNRPLDSGIQISIDGENYSTNINGIDALHKGVEFDFAFMPVEKIELEGSVSIGDWTWQSGDSAIVVDENGNAVYDPTTSQPYVIDFDATGVHVGDAAQTQFAGSARYEFIKNAYIKARFTYFERQYADFNPIDLTGDDERRESWKMPGYGISELHAGYNYKLEKVRLDIRGSILNVFNVKYLSDARNNDSFSTSTGDFDAKSAGVFFGMGRRYNISLQISF